nr:reverse transcriptase domain-containing protein, chloroplastic [Tanacetum cinerariifolium]
MAQLLQAPTEGYEDAIVVPAITAGVAQIWLEKEPPPSIFTWDDLVSKFINQFFPPSKTASLRNEITNFQKRFDESFNEAGDRFKDLLRACLHHAIIKSKSKVHYSCDKPVVSKVSTNASTSGVSPDVVELKDMVKALLLDKKGQNQSPAPVKAVEESCVTYGGAHSYRNCPATNGNNYRDNIQEFVSQASAVNYNQGNTSYRPSMMSNQIRPPSFPPVPNNQNVQRNNQNRFTPNQNRGGFSAYDKANDAVMKNMQMQGQNMQNQLTNLTDLITKFVNSNSASTLSSGTLPSNMIANPKSNLKGITTRSGVSYDGPQISPKAVQSKSPVSTAKPVTSPISEPKIAPVSVSKPNPKASTSYPSRRNDERNPLIENKEKLSEMARTSWNEHCSAVLLKILPEKLGDPGKFLIPCDFPGTAECLALADLGTSINLMPFSMWKRLSIPDLTPTCMTLELADRSISHPVGVPEDVYAKVDEPTSSEFHQSYLDPERDILLLEAFLNDDPSLTPPNQRNYMPEVRKELKICEAKSDKSSVDEPLVVELKVLPPYLEYALLEGDDKLLVIITKDLSVEEKTALITVLKSHKRAIAWKLYDIKGINPEFCTHKILMEEDFKPAVQHQRRVNPKIHDVIKQEVIKLLDTGLIYPISDSTWVSPVHCVPKKGGFTVVENEDNELIPTCLVTGWRVCIDYRKLNEATLLTLLGLRIHF